MKFSASFLKTFMGCPLQARFKHLDEEPSLNNAKAVFGTCIHEALELYNLGRPMEECISRFKMTWHNPEMLGRPIDVWPKFTTYGGLRTKGIDILKTYGERHKWETRKVVAAEHKFCVPFGDHTLSGIVDVVEKKKSGKGKNILRIVDYKTNAKQPTLANLRMDIQFCADEETEILTRRGWKRYEEVLVGEEVLTLNQDVGCAEWQLTEAVNVFDAIDQELVSLEGKDHSSLTTKNHRWPVEHVVSGHDGWYVENRIVTSENLTGSDRITCAAAVSNLPKGSAYTDAFVELVAWFWTEGHVVNGGSLSLAQSDSANSGYVRRIEKVLHELYGERSESLRQTTVPAWRSSFDDDCVRFYLNRVASLKVAAVFDDVRRKIVSPTFVSGLTEEQLRLFTDVSIMADGWLNNNCEAIGQSDRSRLDAIQMAYTLLGKRTCVRLRPVRGNGPYAGNPFYELAVKAATPNFVPLQHKRSAVKYTGKVWCPTTKNGTWLARRNGMVYFTGNTIYVYASEQPEFWMGFEDNPRYPPMPNGEDLFQAYKNVPRRAIWYHLWGSKEIDAGDRDDSDMMRLYRCLTEVEKAVETGVYVPNISGDTCVYCDYTDQCGIVVPIRSKIDREIVEDE